MSSEHVLIQYLHSANESMFFFRYASTHILIQYTDSIDFRLNVYLCVRLTIWGQSVYSPINRWDFFRCISKLHFGHIFHLFSLCNNCRHTQIHNILHGKWPFANKCDHSLELIFFLHFCFIVLVDSMFKI